MLTTSQLTCSSLMLNIPMIKSFISEIHYFTPFYDTLCVIVFQTGSWFFKFLSEIALKTMWLVWFFSKTILETQIINIPSIELIIFNEKTIIRKVTVFADILFLMIKSGVTKWYFHLKESVKRMIFHRSAFHANVPFVSSFYTLVFRSFKRGNTVEKMTRKWSGVVAQRCFAKEVLLKIRQYSQENACVSVSSKNIRRHIMSASLLRICF